VLQDEAQGWGRALERVRHSLRLFANTLHPLEVVAALGVQRARLQAEVVAEEAEGVGEERAHEDRPGTRGVERAQQPVQAPVEQLGIESDLRFHVPRPC
jgi:hypothetical protein